MEATATLRYLKASPQKVRLVADLVRGQPIASALNILAFTPKKGARIIKKVLESAIANAEQRPGVIAENLLVARAWVDEGPTLKRWRPRAYGRATKILKRTSHITLVVRSLGEDE